MLPQRVLIVQQLLRLRYNDGDGGFFCFLMMSTSSKDLLERIAKLAEHVKVNVCCSCVVFFVQNRKKGTDATVMLAAVNEIQGLDAHLAASERFGVICVLFGEACMKLDRVKEATEICVRAAKWPALTERVVALFEKAGNMALEAGQLDDAIVRLTLCMDLSFPPSESVLYSRACAYQRKVS